MSGGAEASGSVPERWFVLTVRSESPYVSGVLVDPLLSLGTSGSVVASTVTV